MFESVVTAILLVAIGLIPVLPKILDGSAWGAEAAAGLIMIGLGLLVLAGEVRAWQRRTRR